MKARRRISAIILVGIAFIAFWQIYRPNELHHKGKPISYWVDRACDSYGAIDEENELFAIGPAAIPYLRNKLRVQETRSDRIMDSVRNHLPDWLESRLPDRLSATTIRGRAIIHLMSFGPKAAPAVPELIALLDANSENREQAVAALGLIGPQAKSALPALHDALKSESSFTRLEIAKVIWNVGRETNLVVNTFVDAITQTNDFDLMMSSVGTLSSLEPMEEWVVPALVQVLTNSAVSYSARGHVAFALGALKATNEASIAALRTTLKTPNFIIQFECAAALWQIDHRNASIAMPFMVVYLMNWNAKHPTATKSLASLASQRQLDLKGAIPQLQDLLQSDVPEIRRLGQEALDKIKADPSDKPKQP